MVKHNLNSTTCTFALALGKFAVKTKIFTLFRICTEISEDIKFHSRTLPKNAATDSLAILHFTTSLLLAIYSYHKAIKTTKFWGNFRMQNLSNLLLPGKKWTTFLQKNICRKKMKLNFWRNLWLSLPKLLLLLLGKVDGNSVSWGTNAS